MLLLLFYKQQQISFRVCILLRWSGWCVLAPIQLEYDNRDHYCKVAITKAKFACALAVAFLKRRSYYVIQTKLEICSESQRLGLALEIHFTALLRYCKSVLVQYSSTYHAHLLSLNQKDITTAVLTKQALCAESQNWAWLKIGTL